MHGMQATQTKRQARRRTDVWTGVRLLGLALLLGLAVVAGAIVQVQRTAKADNLAYYWQRGYYLDHGWLCYGWSTGAFHCTQHWHRDASGRLISDNAAWVPNYGGGVVTQPPVVQPPVTSGGGGTVVVNNVLNEGFCAGQSVSFANVSEWAVPNGCYSGVYYPSNQGYPSFGWCNYWPEAMHPWLGHTYAALSLPSHGGWAPRIGATIFYAPFVQGASAAGHYGVVVAIGPNGWVLSAEMNFYWRGGGFGRVIYRYVHEGWGVDFRY